MSLSLTKQFAGHVNFQYFKQAIEFQANEQLPVGSKYEVYYKPEIAILDGVIIRELTIISGDEIDESHDWEEKDFDDYAEFQSSTGEWLVAKKIVIGPYVDWNTENVAEMHSIMKTMDGMLKYLWQKDR